MATPDRKHLTVYFYPDDKDPLAGRPDGVKPGTWLIRLAKKHVEGRLPVPWIAPPSARQSQKLTVSLSAPLHRKLEQLHPDTPVPDLLRTLALLDAGRVLPGAPADDRGLVVPLRVSARSSLLEGPDLDERIGVLVRQARARSGTERVVNVNIIAELVPVLDRARGETSPAAFLENLLAKDDLRTLNRSLRDELDTSYPAVRLEDPGAVAPLVQRLLAEHPTPPNVHILHAVPPYERMVELVDPVKHGNEEVTLLVRSPDSRRSPEHCPTPVQISGALLHIVWAEHVQCRVQLGHVELGAGELWTYARITPRVKGYRVHRRRPDALGTERPPTRRP